MRNIRILVIDQQLSWRDRFTRMLEGADFSVHVLADYHLADIQQEMHTFSADVVILGCVTIREEEHSVISFILKENYPLLIFCSTISLEMMRSLFLEGVSDIIDKTYDTVSFLEVVKQSIDNIAPEKDSVILEGESTSWFGKGVF